MKNTSSNNQRKKAYNIPLKKIIRDEGSYNDKFSMENYLRQEYSTNIKNSMC